MTYLSKKKKELYIEIADSLKGSDKRLFMARIVRFLGLGGQVYAEQELGWNRQTVRKGTRELESGVIENNMSQRGRKKAEEHLPDLLADLKEIVDGQSQADPTFQTNRLYTRLTVRVIREQLIAQKGYSDEELPREETIRRKLNEMGYRLRAVKKTLPKKNNPPDRGDIPTDGESLSGGEGR